MDLRHSLVLETTRTCSELLENSIHHSIFEDEALERAITLCRDIERHIESWPITKFHRALGFIQGVLVARDITTYERQQQLIKDLSIGFPESPDLDLLDHGTPDVPFWLDLGGSG